MARSKKELGQLLLDNQDLFRNGLCNWVGDLHRFRGLIDEDECTLLLELISSKRPSFIPLLNNIYNPDRKKYDSVFYWEQGCIKPRIKWIKKNLMK